MKRGVLLALCTVACASTPPPETSEPSRAIVIAKPGATESASLAKSPARTPSRDPLAPSLEPPIFYSILFPTSDPHPPADTLPLIDEVVTEMNERPELMLEVHGHIETGEPPGLGFSRAKLVANYLVDHGLKRERIRIVDRADNDPVSKEPAQNRRVSFRPYEAKKP